MPRRKEPPPPPPGSREGRDWGYVLQRFSITIGTGNNNIREPAFGIMQRWLTDHAHLAAMGQEPGAIKKQLHLQIFAHITVPEGSAGCKLISSHIKTALGSLTNDGLKVTIKTCTEQQDDLSMTGYVQKSMGTANYKAFFKNIDEDTQKTAREAYKMHQTSPEMVRVCVCVASRLFLSPLLAFPHPLT